MPRRVVFGRSGLARARDEQMVEPREGIDLYFRIALEAVLPIADVLVDYLVVARAVQNQDRYVETARDCDFVARVEIVVVRRGRAEKILRRRHPVRRDFISFALELREFLGRGLAEVSHLLDDHGGQLAAGRREHHDSRNRPRLLGDFRRHHRAKAMPDDEDPASRHLSPRPQHPHRSDTVLNYFFVHRNLLRIQGPVRIRALVVSEHDDSARAESFGKILEDVIGADRLVAIVRARSGSRTTAWKRTRCRREWSTMPGSLRTGANSSPFRSGT